MSAGLSTNNGLWGGFAGLWDGIVGLSPGDAAPVGTWILLTGFWSDSGVWDDTAFWID